MYTFNSQYRAGLEFISNNEITENDVKNTPMLFSCDVNFAMKYGGHYTQLFLLTLIEHEGLKNYIIDSRVHMLIPGWYPCIPGWHHDDIPRTSINGQPNYDTPEYQSKHCMGLINGEICPTEFAVGEQLFESPALHEVTYGKWNDEVDKHIKRGGLKVKIAPSNRLIFFNNHTWHRGTSAVNAGWRFFIRASWDTNRKIKNEIRNQVQVYLPAITAGW